jgi:hypothetical protein
VSGHPKDVHRAGCATTDQAAPLQPLSFPALPRHPQGLPRAGDTSVPAAHGTATRRLISASVIRSPVSASGFADTDHPLGSGFGVRDHGAARRAWWPESMRALPRPLHQRCSSSAAEVGKPAVNLDQL